ncbi:MAG: UDP-3-O-[3-hydroxymyristoyl] N-acetylglucosamine deacetylase, partial [Gammaproteobacteria bacterium]|nr:UDP-3-O-acyl-N-acetylglucosamine deacetylase [Gemmatimonadota bacterium]NIU79568.1 UDP-3-O-[3-hydroxymyristoyl] N-acetylglucosamine deacetylase [Gammaproteobacteria bacterium]
HVESTELGTSLGAGKARARTVEHLLAAVAALGIDNLVVELDGPEVPILDGSFEPFCEALRAVGPVEQDRPARVVALQAPFDLDGPNGGHYVCAPSDRLRVSAT